MIARALPATLLDGVPPHSELQQWNEQHYYLGKILRIKVMIKNANTF